MIGNSDAKTTCNASLCNGNGECIRYFPGQLIEIIECLCDVKHTGQHCEHDLKSAWEWTVVAIMIGVVFLFYLLFCSEIARRVCGDQKVALPKTRVRLVDFMYRKHIAEKRILRAHYKSKSENLPEDAKAILNYEVKDDERTIAMEVPPQILVKQEMERTKAEEEKEKERKKLEKKEKKEQKEKEKAKKEKEKEKEKKKKEKSEKSKSAKKRKSLLGAATTKELNRVKNRKINDDNDLKEVEDTNQKIQKKIGKAIGGGEKSEKDQHSREVGNEEEANNEKTDTCSREGEGVPVDAPPDRKLHYEQESKLKKEKEKLEAEKKKNKKNKSKSGKDAKSKEKSEKKKKKE